MTISPRDEIRASTNSKFAALLDTFRNIAVIHRVQCVIYLALTALIGILLLHLGNLQGILGRFQVIVVTHPVQSTVYLSLTVLFGALSLHFVCRKRSDRAFWCVIGIILTNFVFSSGYDTGHHLYRIVGISEQLKHGHVSLLLTNPTTGEAFPIFVYYSFVPYLLPTVLNLAGISVLFAFKIGMGLQLIVLALGLQALINKTSLCENCKPRADASFLIAILFVSANYVYGLWNTRAAFAEIWVYSFIPWVVLVILPPHSTRLLTAIFFIQICAHPLVFPQSLVCELVVAFALAKASFAIVVRRCIPPLAISLVLASPFWLPQFIWMHSIVGDAPLPVHFSDTFLSIRQLVDPRFMQNIGSWLPLAIALMILVSRAHLPPRVWVLVSAFVALMAIQTAYLRSVAIWVPLLEQSVFVWRLMLPTAFIAFAALFAGWRVLDIPAEWTLAPLAVISVIGMLLAHSGVPGIAFLSAASNDSSSYTEYLRANNVWGVGPFAPNYSKIARNCEVVQGDESQNISFSELRAGITADRSFIAVRNGPIGFVEYVANGDVLPPSGCYDQLILGPLKLDSRVWVVEDRVNQLLQFRAIGLVAGLVVILLVYFWIPSSGRNLIT
jgi:hypothetical protein